MTSYNVPRDTINIVHYDLSDWWTEFECPFIPHPHTPEEFRTSGFSIFFFDEVFVTKISNKIIHFP